MKSVSNNCVSVYGFLVSRSAGTTSLAPARRKGNGPPNNLNERTMPLWEWASDGDYTGESKEQTRVERCRDTQRECLRALLLPCIRRQ